MGQSYADLARERDVLKSENEMLRSIMDKMLDRGNQLKRELKQSRKETAKEIFQQLYDYCYELADPYSDDEELNGSVEPSDLVYFAGKYGVEVEQ